MGNIALMEFDQAKLLLSNAVGFYVAARRIADGGTGNDFPWPPFFVSIGYAFELSLKAYILTHGGTDGSCRKIGHNLDRAMAEALCLGLQKPGDGVTALLAKIGIHHRKHSFRYMNPVDTKELPNIAETLEATSQHLLCVAAQLQELLPP